MSLIEGKQNFLVIKDENGKFSGVLDCTTRPVSVSLTDEIVDILDLPHNDQEVAEKASKFLVTLEDGDFNGARDNLLKILAQAEK